MVLISRIKWVMLALSLSAMLFNLGCTAIGTNHRLNRGIQLYQTGEYAAAQKEFDALLVVSPQNIPGRLYRGWSLYFQESYTESLACFRAVVAEPDVLKMEQADAWHGIARCLFAQRSYSLSQGAARRSLDLVSENMGLWLVLGWSELYIGRYVQAEEAFTAALHLETNNPEAWLGIGWSRCYLVDYERAIDAADTAFQLGCPLWQLQELERYCNGSHRGH